MTVRVLFAALVLAVVWLFAPANASGAGTSVFQTDMFGQNMAPPVNTGIWGFIRFFFNDARTEADFTLDVKGVSSNQVSTVDMFRGAPGTNGSLVRHLSDGGFLTFGGHLKLSASELDEFMRGDYYVVLTTTLHPGGEVRGQIYIPCGFIAGAAPNCSDPLFAGIPDPVAAHQFAGVSNTPSATPPPTLPASVPQPPEDVGLPPGAVSAPAAGTRSDGPAPGPSLGILPPNTGDGGLIPAHPKVARAAMVGIAAVIIGVGMIFASGFPDPE